MYRWPSALGFAVASASLAGCGDDASWEPVAIEQVAADSTSDTLLLTVSHARCSGDGIRVRVMSQSADAVRVRAEQDRGGSCDDIGLSSELDVELEDIVGNRMIEVDQPRDVPEFRCVVDDQQGQRCVELRPS